jgi:flagellin-like hook-associated protein FlgL
MRITQRAVALTSLQGLNRNLDAVGKLQQQLTSGRLISAPSDSPTGTNRAMQTRGDQAAVAQQSRNLTDAQNWLEQIDSALQTMLSTARRVRDLTVQGLNTGATSDVSQQALATEVTSLRDSLLSLANLQIQGRPLFGGVTSGGKAYDSSTGAWLGQQGAPVTRRVSDTEKIRVDLTGPEAFGSTPDGDLFAVVGKIAADMSSPTAASALTVHLADLDEIMNGMEYAVADVGTRASRVEKLQLINFDRALALESQLTQTEKIDLPNTIMRLEMQKVGYEAALAATAKAIQPTLMDYLR